MGGRATSGLQGQYGQVGTAPDQLGGVGPECEQVSALRPIRECLYLCACFVVSRGTGEQRERGPTRSVPEIACLGSQTRGLSWTLLSILVLLRFAIKTLPVREDELWPPCAL